ncbi:MAG: sodium/proton-translocating pyrophosphatase [Fimbriimonadaceae bacterium]|nr:sodium/proton-translocating pyrophosphatase [Fimbriimonadaceae bacterium]
MEIRSMTTLAQLGRTGRKPLAWLLSLLLTLFVPAMACASEADVKLVFSAQDKMMLYISLALGVVAIATAFYIRGKILNQSPGDERMQEVGRAIREGALAYLRQQARLMGVFILILSVLLFFMYQPTFGQTVAILMVVCFILGVGASYIAGYVGMDSAVNGNMRTAHAALTSYKSSLETAFLSGAIAGLLTVGLGLLGATLIFLFAGADATKLLVGFGFGGSLAALFMRVGGGIYTKAADVGADLVGKVEAGIPEDDPRNPAVIADNVGDNVGDCAGMAADVFESYEVTLVAAIVLGAATAVIFDQATWMKLVLFALMARGIGIVASIIGIFMVKGSDNLNDDPLKSIRRGFVSSAVISVVGTLALAFVMMGGTGSKVNTNQFVSQAHLVVDTVKTIRDTRANYAKANGKKVEDVKATDILKEKAIEDLGMREQTEQLVTSILGMSEDQLPKVPENEPKYSAVDLSDTKGVAGTYTVAVPPANPNEKPSYQSLGEYLKAQPLFVYEVELTQNSPSMGADSKPVDNVQTIHTFVGPMTEKEKTTQFESFTKMTPGNKVVPVGTPLPVKVFAAKDGSLAFGVDTQGKGVPVFNLRTNLQVYKDSVDKVKGFFEKPDPNAVQPKPATVTTGKVDSKVVPWWTFLVCILFGVLMAFAFEALTDYYVSLHKKPVNELGHMASAGPAPMIISGFAYGQESSVFSLFAIVLSLIVPLVVFPAAVYGGYILSFYGIALVGLGLLTTTGFILAMDTFGPISDNAQGVFEMSGAGHENAEGARRVQLLDAAGNTTKALTKGFAIATAVVAAVALFHAFVEEGQLAQAGMRLEIPQIFLGLLIGGAAPFLFSAFSINAVGRAAFELINEVRRQFHADKGIMEGTSKPDYAKCVAIVTAAAQKELIGPGILAIGFPVLVAFGFAIGQPTTNIGGVEYNLVGAQALGGFLAGAILSGQLLAVMLANSGGMWDNSKKLIEDGLWGGKGTDAHKAAVVCDTVGDPFKDTAGPAMNPLIKVMNLVALLIAPQVIQPWSQGVLITVTVIAAVALAVAIYWSKRGSMASGMQSAAAEEPSA